MLVRLCGGGVVVPQPCCTFFNLFGGGGVARWTSSSKEGEMDTILQTHKDETRLGELKR